MKKYYLLLIVFLSLCSAQAKNAKEAFLSMPIDMLLDVSIDNRTDLVESFEAYSKATVQNKLKEDIFIEEMKEDYFRLNIGSANLQIIVLNRDDKSQLYCFIRTVCAPLCDSKIEFYSADWKKLETNDFISIAPQTEFIDRPEDYYLLETIQLMQFNYDSKNKILSQKNNSIALLSLEDQEKIKSDIKKEIKEYNWNGTRFL